MKYHALSLLLLPATGALTADAQPTILTDAV